MVQNVQGNMCAKKLTPSACTCQSAISLNTRRDSSQVGQTSRLAFTAFTVPSSRLQLSKSRVTSGVSPNASSHRRFWRQLDTLNRSACRDEIGIWPGWILDGSEWDDLWDSMMGFRIDCGNLTPCVMAFWSVRASQILPCLIFAVGRGH